jgi:hypothetical protein
MQAMDSTSAVRRSVRTESIRTYRAPRRKPVSGEPRAAILLMGDSGLRRAEATLARREALRPVDRH